MPASTYGRALVTVNVGEQTSNNASFFYYEVAKVKIPYGPTIGTTTVTIHGRGFVDFGFIAVRFGNGSRAMEVNGTLLTDRKIVCVTPPSRPQVVVPLLRLVSTNLPSTSYHSWCLRG